VLGLALATGCKRDSGEEKPSSTTEKASHEDHGHADGAADGHVEGDAHGGDHEHGGDVEVELGTVTIGDMKVTFAQGHGKVAAAKEGHLVVKLPYNDKGATTVRAWIGTEDRTLSLVGKGGYAPSHDDYDVHAIAPDPLPKNVMWWIEIQKPDGTKLVGSIKPLLD
jgi:hypothetical protein